MERREEGEKYIKNFHYGSFKEFQKVYQNRTEANAFNLNRLLQS